MGDDSQNILKRKIAAASCCPDTSYLVEDMSERIGVAAATAFGKFYGEKCQLAESEPAFIAKLDEALAPYAPSAGIYQFRFRAEDDFLIVLDVDISMRAAGWSLAQSRETPDPLPDSVCAIDRRLAKPLAEGAAEAIFENAAASGFIDGGIELIASGNDPRRFEFSDDSQRVVCATFSIKTLEEEILGTMRVFAAEKTTLAMREHYETTLVLAEQKWVQDLKKLALMSPMKMRADLAAEDITLGSLMELKPGQVINLSMATIDEVTVTPALQTESKLSMVGALGNRDGARALRIKSVSY